MLPSSVRVGIAKNMFDSDMFVMRLTEPSQSCAFLMMGVKLAWRVGALVPPASQQAPAAFRCASACGGIHRASDLMLESQPPFKRALLSV